ncbi:MAG: chemotaxis protein CheD [Thermoplasmata archaeon]|nr:chemotaxis protein CheD [Thermoplasmata archaeon]
MNMAKLVGIADVAVARAPEQLCCIGLGSCVAVFIYDPETRIGGVLHALLPRAPDGKRSDAKYADSGIRMLHQMIISKGAKKWKLWAKLVGGARMFPNLNIQIRDIGGENVRQARKTLRELGVRIVAEEVEGNRGRSAYYSLEDGKVTLKTAFSTDKEI